MRISILSELSANNRPRSVNEIFLLLIETFDFYEVNRPQNGISPINSLLLGGVSIA